MKKFKLVIAIALLFVVAATIALTGCTNNTNKDNGSTPLSLEEIFVSGPDEWAQASYGIRNTQTDKIIPIDTFDVSSLRTGTDDEPFVYIRLFFNYDKVKNRHYNKVKMTLTASNDAQIRVFLQDSYTNNPKTIFDAQDITFQAEVAQDLEFGFAVPIDLKNYNYIHLSHSRIYLYEYAIRFDWPNQYGQLSYRNWPRFTISNFEILEVAE